MEAPGNGLLRERVNTEFDWEVKMGIENSVLKKSCPLTKVSGVKTTSIVSTGLHQLPPLTASGTTSVFRGKAARALGNSTKMATSNRRDQTSREVTQ